MARIRIGDLLVKAGLIDEMQLQSALAHQRQWGGKLGDILVNNGFLDEMMLWKGLSHQLGVPLVSLPDARLPTGIEKVVPVELCEKHQIFPVARDDKSVTVATSDPNNLGGIDEVAFRLGVRLKVVLAPDREIEWAIRRYHHGDPTPCPPPRVRRTADAPPADAPPPTAPSMPPTVSLGAQTATPLQELAAVAARTVAAVAAAGGVTVESGALAQTEQAIRETANLLRFVVDACVQRGVFTREEYLARLRALS